MRHEQGAHVLLFVGSYSQPVPHAPGARGAGLTILDVEVATGRVQIRFEDNSIPNPAYLCVDARRHLVYVVSEVWDGDDGSVAALQFDRDFESLLSQSELSTGGGIPSYVSLVDDRFALVSNYGDGSLAAFALASDGHLASRASMVNIRGSGPDADRQRGPHAHCVLPHPRNGRIYAADLGADKLIQLAFNASSGVLTVDREYRVTPGSGPRHIVFDPSTELALVVNELSSRLGVWSVGSDGDLVQADELPMLPDESGPPSFGADIVVTSDGAKAFASNRGHDSIAMYDKTAAGGFQVAGWQPTGATPRSLALTTGGGYLFVANQDSDNLQAYRVADGGGLAEDLAFPIGTPTVVKCVNAPRPE